VSLDRATSGRFELGIGWGSVPAEFETFGIGDTAAPPRVRRLAETLELLKALWTGERIDYAGEFHQVVGGIQNPTPLDRIPIVIGGAGPKTMELVAAHADVWNCPVYALDRFAEIREQAGAARPSIQEMIGFIPPGGDRQALTELNQKRFGYLEQGLVIGDGPELIDHFGELLGQGVERFYTWFTDFATPETLEAFAENVIAKLAD